MPKIRVPLQLGYYQDESLSIGDQECLNMYPSATENPGAGSAAVIKEVEGLLSLGLLTDISDIAPDSILRGAVRSGNNIFCVYADHIIRVRVSTDSVVFVSDLGTFTTTLDQTVPVSMETNGKLIAIVSPGLKAVVFVNVVDLVVSSVATPNNFTVTDVTYQNGFFIYVGTTPTVGSNLSGTVVYHGLSKTDVSLGSAFNVLDFTLSDIIPDIRVVELAIASVNGILYVMGGGRSEIYQYSGAAQFAFRKVVGTWIDVGCYNASCKIVVGGKLYTIGRSGESELGVYIIEGTVKRKISTPVIDKAISDSLTSMTGIFFPPPPGFRSTVWTFKSKGHEFIGFNLYSDFVMREGKTFVYDLTQSTMSGFNVWHRRSSELPNSPAFARFYALLGNRTFALGWKTNGVTEFNDVAVIDHDKGEQFGIILKKDVSFNYINTEFNRVRFKKFQLYGDNLLPTVEMSHAEINGSGTMNESVSRISGSTNKNFQEWRRLGKSKLPRRFRLKMDQGTSNPGIMTFTDAYIEVPDGG